MEDAMPELLEVRRRLLSSRSIKIYSTKYFETTKEEHDYADNIPRSDLHGYILVQLKHALSKKAEWLLVSYGAAGAEIDRYTDLWLAAAGRLG